MAETTRWLEYGDAVDDDRVEATIRETTTGDGGDGDTPDVVRTGTIERDALDLLDSHEDVAAQEQTENGVKLTGLSKRVEDRLLATFEESKAA